MSGRICIIDDDDQWSAVLAELLEEEGYATARHSSAEAAFAALERGPAPALVLLDIRIAGATDGWGVHAWLKRQPALERVPVIMISGTPISSSMRDLLNRDAPTWLEKPVSVDTLLDAVRRNLGSPPG